jgi:hypothetical protein
VAHFDGLKPAFGSASTASGTGSAGNVSDLFLLPLDGPKGADPGALATFLAQVIVYYGRDCLDREFALVQQDGSP